MKHPRNSLLSTGTVTVNRRAGRDYFIEEEMEAGLVLVGSEVKSLRAGAVNLSDAYAGPKDGEIFLFNLHIGDYAHAPRRDQHAPKRPRKLLLRKRERDRLIGAVRRDGMTLAPLRLYFNSRGLCKLALGLARGKKEIDKRETIKERDWQRRKAGLMKRFG